MKVKWKVPVELEVIESFDKAMDDVDSYTERFNAGEVTEFDIFGYAERFVKGKLKEDKTLPNIQFGDGSVTFGVSTEWFEVIEK
jgi:hypothetical protein